MRLRGRLAKKYLALLGSIELDGTTHLSPLWVNNRCCPVPVSTGWEQDAQFLSSHGGCLSTAVVQCQCSRVKVPVHTGVVRSWVFLGSVNFPGVRERQFGSPGVDRADFRFHPLPSAV